MKIKNAIMCLYLTDKFSCPYCGRDVKQINVAFPADNSCHVLACMAHDCGAPYIDLQEVGEQMRNVINQPGFVDAIIKALRDGAARGIVDHVENE